MNAAVRRPLPLSSLQDPELRAKFAGAPEHVVNYLFMVAEDLRGIMATLGISKVHDLVGRADLLEPDATALGANPKLAGIDLTALLTPAATLRPGAAQTCVEKQDHGLEESLDFALTPAIAPALATPAVPVAIETRIVNTNRAVGATLSHEIVKAHGGAGLPDDTIVVRCTGSAGQSFGAFTAPGLTLALAGDANDYVGKGLSGGIVAVFPDPAATFDASTNVIVGNVCLYGATAGALYAAGLAAERFAVRNSGAVAVVEGVGDHACEYMTGGTVVVLGATGKNFGAGMSGGVAYVHDPDARLAPRCNVDVAGDLLPVIAGSDDESTLVSLLQAHVARTGSKRGAALLADWQTTRPAFLKVFPHEYAAALARAAAKTKAEAGAAAELASALAAEAGDASALAAAGAAPRDAWAALVALGMEPMARGQGLPPPPTPSGDPAADLSRLATDAAAGLPVAGRPPTWAADRPASVKAGTAGNVRGFIDYARTPAPYRAVEERVKDWGEVLLPQTAAARDDRLSTQTARCQNCGTPTCHAGDVSGCPVGNEIPTFNALVYDDDWRTALDVLQGRVLFPEFTGRVCPAPCEVGRGGRREEGERIEESAARALTPVSSSLPPF